MKKSILLSFLACLILSPGIFANDRYQMERPEYRGGEDPATIFVLDKRTGAIRGCSYHPPSNTKCSDWEPPENPFHTPKLN